jgi:hypothetical protein
MFASPRQSEPDPAGTQRVAVDDLVARILSRWRGRLRRLPDRRPRTGERGDSERVLVSTLLRIISSDESSAEENLPGLAVAAARYGAGQRRERIDPGGLCDELSSLRSVVWEVLKERDDPSRTEAVERIFRFDRALSIVTRAALKAGYDPEEAKRSIHCGDVIAGHEALSS